MKIDGAACILGALAILILPLNWVLAGIIAAGFHELCHCLTVKAMGGRVWEFRIGVGGAVMETSPISTGRELLCVLAGPLGGIFLMLFYRWIPRVAISAGLQSAFNLLPIYPLDGGRALGCMIELLPRKYRVVGRRIQNGLSIGIAAGVVFMAASLRLPALIIPFLPALKEKYLAKRGKKGYNIVTLK